MYIKKQLMLKTLQLFKQLKVSVFADKGTLSVIEMVHPKQNNKEVKIEL